MKSRIFKKVVTWSLEDFEEYKEATLSFFISGIIFFIVWYLINSKFVYNDLTIPILVVSIVVFLIGATIFLYHVRRRARYIEV
jgi:cell division protein FtsW (lipid II flippase)